MLLLIPTISAAQDVKSVCPKKCHCSKVEIVCRNIGLDKVPPDLPTGDGRFKKM